MNSAGITIGQASGAGRVSLSRSVAAGTYRIVYAGSPGTTAYASYQLGLVSRGGYITF